MSPLLLGSAGLLLQFIHVSWLTSSYGYLTARCLTFKTIHIKTDNVHICVLNGDYLCGDWTYALQKGKKDKEREMSHENHKWKSHPKDWSIGPWAAFWKRNKSYGRDASIKLFHLGIWWGEQQLQNSFHRAHADHSTADGRRKTALRSRIAMPGRGLECSLNMLNTDGYAFASNAAGQRVRPKKSRYWS